MFFMFQANTFVFHVFTYLFLKVTLLTYLALLRLSPSLGMDSANTAIYPGSFFILILSTLCQTMVLVLIQNILSSINEVFILSVIHSEVLLVCIFWLKFSKAVILFQISIRYCSFTFTLFRYLGLNLPISNSCFAHLLAEVFPFITVNRNALQEILSSGIIILLPLQTLSLKEVTESYLCSVNEWRKHMSSSLKVQQSFQSVNHTDVLGRLSSNTGLTSSSLLGHTYPITANSYHSSLFYRFFKFLFISDLKVSGYLPVLYTQLFKTKQWSFISGILKCNACNKHECLS